MCVTSFLEGAFSIKEHFGYFSESFFSKMLVLMSLATFGMTQSFVRVDGTAKKIKTFGFDVFTPVGNRINSIFKIMPEFFLTEMFQAKF